VVLPVLANKTTSQFFGGSRGNQPRINKISDKKRPTSVRGICMIEETKKQRSSETA
jgi:hypothetical protein